MRTIWITVIALVALSQSAAGQDQFERQVRTQLDKVGQNLAKQGFELTTQVYTGELNEDRNEEVTVKLRAGVRYALVGVCDVDCKDLDLVLYDSSHRELVNDVEKDDVPVVEIRPEKNGTYTARAVMASCSAEPCSYGLGLFASAVDPFERQVRQQLDGAAGRLRKDGYVLTHQIHTGELKEDEQEDVTVELEKGVTYVILGVCDNDCKDVDLRLMNRAGKEVDTDVEVDDYPAVAVAPDRKERYTVRAIMAACRAAPCAYGFGVFAK